MLLAQWVDHLAGRCGKAIALLGGGGGFRG